MSGADPGIPILSVVPFGVLLLAIAVLPLLMPHRWESHRTKAWLVAALSLPTALYLLSQEPAALGHALLEYTSFLCLLGALFTVSGGLFVGGDLRATPRVNVMLMGVGAVLANLIGTTGASMLLIRLLLRTNSERRHTAHLPFFFILLVSNCGGLLTPLGDPPLFLGYLRGVPFFFTLRLFPLWLVCTGYLLTVLFLVDRAAYARESKESLSLDQERIEPLSVLGWLNAVWLGFVVGAVFLPSPYREFAMIILSLASLRFGPAAARSKNQFTFGPIIEVAVLFFGIFVTMVPALELLRQHGSELGLSQPYQFFLVTGVLSSVLDNAPTYLTFLASAQGLGLSSEVVGVPVRFLLAISAGAVLMGANTYIGNGPNFMVKAIAEQAGVPMPSFFGYALRALLVLSPIYLLVTFGFMFW